MIGETGLKKGDPNLLVLTNAGYGTINGESTEAFLDLAREKTDRCQGVVLGFDWAKAYAETGVKSEETAKRNW